MHNDQIVPPARGLNRRMPDTGRLRSWRVSRAVRAWGILAAALFTTGAGSTGEPGSFSISEKSFRCMTEMTHIGHVYVDNLAGNLKGTVRVAK
jgi:hypothetical protein